MSALEDIVGELDGAFAAVDADIMKRLSHQYQWEDYSDQDLFAELLGEIYIILADLKCGDLQNAANELLLGFEMGFHLYKRLYDENWMEAPIVQESQAAGGHGLSRYLSRHGADSC